MGSCNATDRVLRLVVAKNHWITSASKQNKTSSQSIHLENTIPQARTHVNLQHSFRNVVHFFGLRGFIVPVTLVTQMWFIGSKWLVHNVSMLTDHSWWSTPCSSWLAGPNTYKWKFFRRLTVTVCNSSDICLTTSHKAF